MGSTPKSVPARVHTRLFPREVIHMTSETRHRAGRWFVQALSVVGILIAMFIILIGAYSAITINRTESYLTHLGQENKSISESNARYLAAAAGRQKILVQILGDLSSEQKTSHTTLLEFEKDVNILQTTLDAIQADQLHKDDINTQTTIKDIQLICKTLKINCPPPPYPPSGK